MPAPLREPGAIFDCDHQQQAWLARVFGPDAPTARDRQRVIKDVLPARSVDHNHRHLDLMESIKIAERGFQARLRGAVDYAGIIVDVSRRRWQRRLRRLRKDGKRTGQQQRASRTNNYKDPDSGHLVVRIYETIIRFVPKKNKNAKTR